MEGGQSSQWARESDQGKVQIFPGSRSSCQQMKAVGRDASSSGARCVSVQLTCFSTSNFLHLGNGKEGDDFFLSDSWNKEFYRQKPFSLPHLCFLPPFSVLYQSAFSNGSLPLYLYSNPPPPPHFVELASYLNLLLLFQNFTPHTFPEKHLILLLHIIRMKNANCR